jgi:hypothetical protein
VFHVSFYGAMCFSGSKIILSSAARLSTLAVTFTLQPTKNGLLNPVRSFLHARSPCLSQRLGELHRHVELHAGSRLDKISKLLHVDGLRLATAYAECAILRIALKPLLVIHPQFIRVATSIPILRLAAFHPMRVLDARL